MRGFKKKIALAGVFWVCLMVSAYSQITDIEQLSPYQLKRFAKSATRANDAHTAILFYDKYLSLKPKDQSINYELAELHRQVRNYIQARDLYEEVSKEAGKKFPLAQFYYALMLKATGNYDDAIDQFKKFRRNYSGKDENVYSKIVRNEMAGCDSANGIIKNPLNVAIDNLNSSINSPHIELSPIPVDDETFIYASLRADSLVFFTDKNVDTAMPVRQFYIAKKEGMDWNGGELLPGNINIPGVETGNGVLSRDGNRFYFTRCERTWQGEVICAIYRATKEGDSWGKIEKLPPIVNDPNYTSTQPALGRTAKSDREIIFYVSNKPDGKGGLEEIRRYNDSQDRNQSGGRCQEMAAKNCDRDHQNCQDQPAESGRPCPGAQK